MVAEQVERKADNEVGGSQNVDQGSELLPKYFCGFSHHFQAVWVLRKHAGQNVIRRGIGIPVIRVTQAGEPEQTGSAGDIVQVNRLPFNAELRLIQLKVPNCA